MISKANLEKIKSNRERGYQLKYERLYFKTDILFDIYETVGIGWIPPISEDLFSCLISNNMNGFETSIYDHTTVLNH
ncbi:hypothetical protein LCGC14_1520320 [marine sediment metagenome]|uniref:Uncharacterized protein n=1 Tax=marine sediment metagenome TaxID=412755 RepID=A0A0F9IZ06_9ZZZZ